MSQCPYFQVWRKQIPKRSASADEATHHEIRIPYCTHKGSPRTLEMAQHSLGKGPSLKCDGIIKRCPLPEQMRPLPQAAAHVRASRQDVEGCYASLTSITGKPK